jgi:dCTP diphosphatase
LVNNLSAGMIDYMNIKQIVEKLITFRKERDWEQFHNPKNVAISLSIEANELLEHFQWITLEQASDLSPAKKEQVQDELADVAAYLLYLAHDLDINILEAIEKKLKKNAKKYPIEKARGNSLKYNKL